MKSEKEELKYCRLIFRDLIGELSPDESDILRQWLEETPDNRELYARFSDRKNVMDRLREYEDIPVDLYLRQFETQIRPAGRGRTLRRRLVVWASISAVLAGVVFLTLDSRKGGDSKVAEQTIQPGSSMAVLVLADGRSVQLTERTDPGVTGFDDTGISISKNSIDYSYADPTVSTSTHKIMVPTGGEYIAVLSDGSRVFLKSESSLEYPVAFGSSSRDVRFEGEAYFEITEDASKPFNVLTKGMDVSVLGTEFNLRAYADEDRTEATLITGSVKVSTPHAGTVILAPSQQVTSIPGSDKLILSAVDTRVYTGYKEGQFVFRESRLEDIVNTLKRWYDFEVVFKDEKARDILFSGRINRQQSIYSFLDIMETTKKIKVTVTDKVITFASNK